MSRTYYILATIRSQLMIGSDFTDANTIIVAAPIFLSGYGPDFYAQVHPMSGEYITGGHALYVEQDFGVSIFGRMLLDREGHDTQHLTNATSGLYARMDAVYTRLNHNRLGDKLAVGLIPTRIETPASGPEGIAGDWAKLTAIWRCRYGATYAGP